MTDRPGSGDPMDRDPLFDLTGADLETALVDLGGALAPPAAPDLARAVRLRVETMGVPSSVQPSWLGRLVRPTDRVTDRPTGRPLRRGLVLAIVALLILAGIAAAIGFGLPGLRIVVLGPGQTDTPPGSGSGAPSSGVVTSPVPTGSSPGAAPSPSTWPIESLGLGDPVDPIDGPTLDAAAGYHVLVPTLPELGRPLAAFVRGQAPLAQVALAYGPSATIPAASGAPDADGTPVAIVVMQYPGTTDGAYLKKVVQPGTTVSGVEVGGHPGFWIAGRPHELMYVRPDGEVDADTVRLVGNVLAWNDGELTLRIEGAPDLATALRIAESMP